MPEIGPRCTQLRSPFRRALPTALTVLVLTAAALPTSAQPPRLAPDPGTRSFSFPEPTPADEIYRVIGEAFGLGVQFDPHLKPVTLTLELEDVEALEALDRVAASAGHFYKPLDERSILIAADTPQNRRTYEEMVIRTFQLTEADPRVVMTLLRSIVDVRKVAVDTDRRTITVRDVADKVAVAEDLIAVADRRPGEAEVAVELFEVDRAALDSWLAGRPDAGSTHRLAAGELAELERSTAATPLVRPRLGLIADRPATYQLKGVPAAAGEGGNGEPEQAGGAEDPFRVFGIEIAGRIHPAAGGPGEITLEIDVATRELHPARPDVPGDKDRSLVAGELTSSVRLADGETFLITGLGSAQGSGGAAGSGRAADLRAPVGRPDRALVVALTPRVIHAPEPIPEGLAAMWVGTEAHVRYGAERQSSLP
jgi:general secretion pathway protein D